MLSTLITPHPTLRFNKLNRRVDIISHYEVDSISNVARSLVWMIYLNDVPEGEGETEFLWQGLRVQPKAGTMLIWASTIYSHS